MEPILLVEDKPELRAMLRKALERADYSVEEAPDGNAAIDKIRARRSFLCRTELKLPGSSGLDVLRGSSPRGTYVAVILVTPMVLWKKAVTAMKEGAF
jgi:DNA-binding NtrC family response regulator